VAALILLSMSIQLRISAAEVAQAPIEAELAAKTPEGMVFVPGGEFTMGTDNGDREGSNLRQNSDAVPAHKVTLAPFYIDKYEVTNADYKRYCDATKYPPPPHWPNGNFVEGVARCPVTYINWWEAGAYARWAGKRLPTEAEWEKAARGNDGRNYPWGNNWDAARVALAHDRVQPIGSRPEGASPYGAIDMAGNALEWVDDWYRAYPGARHNYPDYGTKYKVARGGFFWGTLADILCTTYYRSVNRPSGRHPAIGFRCAKSAP
jgi:formylglycine-generating enzyme required for sulfatase activity